MTREEPRRVVTERPGHQDAHGVLVAVAGFVKLPAPHHGVMFRLAVGQAPLLFEHVGAHLFMWATDYPHPDAKFPGVVDELDQATRALDAAPCGRYFGDV